VILWLLANVPFIDFALGGMLLALLPEAMRQGIDIALEPVVSAQAGMLDRIYGHPFMGIHSSGRILQFIAMQAALIAGVVFTVTFSIGACLNRFRDGAKQ
jgi:hypothetical protein